jgi:hypothetical protein
VSIVQIHFRRQAGKGDLDDEARMDSGEVPPPAAAFSISSPVNGASVAGVIPIHGVAGSQWVNVAVFDASTYAKVAADAAPANGAFTLSLDTTQFANGPVQLNVQAFSVPAGQSGGPFLKSSSK